MPDVRDRQQGYLPLVQWEKCLKSVSGKMRVGLIRCTGRYDNISFIIKTPFFLFCAILNVGNCFFHFGLVALLTFCESTTFIPTFIVMHIGHVQICLSK